MKQKFEIFNEKYTIHYLNSFINQVFNYFNGHINICNPSEIEAIYIKDSSANQAANTWYPNKIKIYPYTIYNYSQNFDEFCVLIVESIIHELYHADQIIFMDRVMRGDVEYINNIESAVEFMTYSYIMNNLSFIQYAIAQYYAVIDIEDIKRYCCNKPSAIYYPYERKTYVDHILLSLPAMIPSLSSLYISELMPYFEDENSKIIFMLNGNFLTIKDGNNFEDINIFNHFIYEYYCKFNHTKLSKIDDVSLSLQDDNSIVFRIKFKGFNDMARTVDNTLPLSYW